MALEIKDGYQELELVRTLFQEYAEQLGVDLCFQNFAGELAGLPGKYARPTGRLFVAWQDGRPAGCIALRRFDETRCEMKRLFVRPEFRSFGIGKALVERLITEAAAQGYEKMLLDTLTTLRTAVNMYRRRGFYEIAPYYRNDENNVVYLCLDLSPSPEAIPWNAQLYADKHDFIAEYGKGLLDYLENDPDQQILDLGCGTGGLTEALAAKAGRVVGVDGSAEMVAQAQKLHPEFSFYVQDACQLEWVDAFDVVFSNAVFHWIPDQPALLKSVYQVLKPGGKLIAEFGAAGNIAAIERAFAAALAVLGRTYTSGFYFPSPQAYQELLQQAGFRCEQIFDFDRPTPLKDGEQGLSHWLKQFFARDLAALTGAEAERVLKTVENQLRDRFYKDGQWLADYRRLRLVAVKNNEPN